MTRVPSVVNNTTETAEERLTNAVLLYMVVGKDYSELVPANLVLTQELSAGVIVQQNSICNVMISGGTEVVKVPYVVNLPSEEAVSALRDLGLVASITEDYSSVIPEGFVISQGEDADMDVSAGAVISIVISKGRNPEEAVEDKEIVLPDLVGKTYDEVIALAESGGFLIEVSEWRYSAVFDANIVMEQSPSKGKTIKAGDTVTIIVSRGKQQVTVADVRYCTEKDARSILNRLGLNVTVSFIESDTVAAGLVISQNPVQGSTANPGDEVALVISKGAASFAMPDVVGKTEGNAKAVLVQAGLSVMTTYEHSNKTAGTVLRQSISANTQVTKGTRVSITVSSGEETVVVPNVIGKKQQDAESALKAKGFAVAINSVYSDTVTEGLVITQSPQPNTSQRKGMTVVLMISKGKDYLKSIEIQSMPSKTTYFLGETFNPAGMSLTATYRSGKTETIGGGIPVRLRCSIRLATKR